MKKRSLLRLLCDTRLARYALVPLAVMLFLAGCGKNYYFAGRNLPPSGLTNRVLITIANPSAFTTGSLIFVDAFYDIRHAYNNINVTFSIGGASVNEPATIQNMPEEQAGAVYSSGNGSLSLISYSTEKQSSALTGSPAASIFISRNFNYLASADQTSHYLIVQDRVIGRTIGLNLPGVYRVSVNPSGTIALAFVQNSDTAYSLVHLTSPQQTAYQAFFAANGTWPANTYGLPAQDCEPQNLPVYCVYPVADSRNAPAVGKAAFDRPVKALFSPDGSSIYVLSCGPECGGLTSGITTIPIATSSLNTGVLGPAALNLSTNAGTSPPQPAAPGYAVPGGATNAIGNGTTLYVAGQSVNPDGYLSGNLTVFSFTNNAIEGTYPIADGAHNKMLFADDNTLFVGSTQCQSGERYHLNPSSSSGCLSMFNTGTNAVTLDTYQGDLTGIADIEGLHKIYVAEGGQVYIYSTSKFPTQLDNSNVSVVGTATDVAYMDGSSDENNTTY